MSFKISKEQQKIFIEQFMTQVLDLSLSLVDEGKDRGSPGATIHAVGAAIIREIYRQQDETPEGDVH